jgi:hypothetical protein
MSPPPGGTAPAILRCQRPASAPADASVRYQAGQQASILGRLHCDGCLIAFSVMVRRMSNSSVGLRTIGSRGRNKAAASACTSTVFPSLQSRKVSPISAVHYEEGWRFHQPAKLRQRGFHEGGMWPFRRQTYQTGARPRTKRGLMITSIPNDQRDHQITRRDIILGVAASLICAPAIVRITNLMPVRRLPFPFGPQSAGFVERLYLHALERHVRNLRAGQTSTIFNGTTLDPANARRRVAYAQAHGFLPPYICIYRSD